MIRRIAVQISGEIRNNWQEVYNMWSFYNEDKPEGIEIDFFLACWNNDYYQGGADLFTAERIDAVPAKYTNCKSITKYYDRWGRVNTLRRLYEYDNNIEYDLVFQLRPDLYVKKFWNGIHRLNNDIINEPYIAVLNDNMIYCNSPLEVHKNEDKEQNEGYHFLDDKFFFSTPLVIDYLTSFSKEYIRGGEHGKYGEVTYHVGLAHWVLDGRLIVKQSQAITTGLSRDFNSYKEFYDKKD